MLTKDGLELSVATQLARKNLGDLDVTVSIDGFVDLCRLAIKGLDTPPPYVHAGSWQPIASAPKDGTLLLLLIGADDAREHPLEDTAEGSRTIGQNNFENDGEDRWQFAGWCWDHDHYSEGAGAPTHWQPMPDAPAKEPDWRDAICACPHRDDCEEAGECLKAMKASPTISHGGES